MCRGGMSSMVFGVWLRGKMEGEKREEVGSVGGDLVGKDIGVWSPSFCSVLEERMDFFLL